MFTRSLLLALLLAAPLFAQDKGPVFSRKYFMGADAAAVWDAVVNPDVVKKYHHAPLGGIELKKDGDIWYGTADKKVLTGKVLEVDAGKKLSHTFKFAHRNDEASRVTYEIEALGDMCALKLTHDQFASETETYKDVSNGWDIVLSNMKTLLETGDVLPWPQGEAPVESDLRKSQFVELPSAEQLPGRFETFKVDLTGDGGHGWGNEVERGEVALQKGYALSFYCDENISNAQLAKLKSVPRLARLIIAYAGNVNDRGMLMLSSLVDLRELTLSALKITERGLRGVSALKNLETINVSSCPAITGEFLLKLPAPEKLNRATFSWIDISDVTLKALAKCVKLWHLRFSDGAEVTDAGLAALKGLTKLQELALPSRSKITDAGLKNLAGMTALKTLEINGIEGLTGGMFETIGGLEALTDLEIGYCPNLEPPKAEAFSKLKALSRISLTTCPKLNDDLAAALAACPALTNLSLTDIALTDAGVEVLCGKELKLTSLYTTKLKVTDAACKALAKMQTLVSLSLDYCDGITDAGVKELAALKSLRELGLRGSETITDAALDEIPNFPSLTSLGLYYCKKITKAAVEKLRAAKPNLWVSFD